MIGGSGERKTLRLVAQYADACNIFASTPAEVGHKLDVLRRHCDDVGRDEAAIRKTVLYSGGLLLSGDVDAFVTEMADYARLGVEEVVVMPIVDDPDAWIEKIGTEVTPRLAELAP